MIIYESILTTLEASFKFGGTFWIFRTRVGKQAKFKLNYWVLDPKFQFEESKIEISQGLGDEREISQNVT